MTVKQFERIGVDCIIKHSGIIYTVTGTGYSFGEPYLMIEEVRIPEKLNHAPVTISGTEHMLLYSDAEDIEVVRK